MDEQQDFSAQYDQQRNKLNALPQVYALTAAERDTLMAWLDEIAYYQQQAAKIQQRVGQHLWKFTGWHDTGDLQENLGLGTVNHVPILYDQRLYTLTEDGLITVE